jgi:hypothetical protein
LDKKYIAINKYSGQEHEVLDINGLDKINEIDMTWISIKKKKKSKPTWHTLRDYDIKEIKEV